MANMMLAFLAGVVMAAGVTGAGYKDFPTSMTGWCNAYVSDVDMFNSVHASASGRRILAVEDIPTRAREMAALHSGDLKRAYSVPALSQARQTQDFTIEAGVQMEVRVELYCSTNPEQMCVLDDEFCCERAAIDMETLAVILRLGAQHPDNVNEELRPSWGCMVEGSNIGRNSTNDKGNCQPCSGEYIPLTIQSATSLSDNFSL
mmetsp:Transcript_17902/g.50433  ORF Transcript_17902/g.50433 Transcript_17902/m.50433 type:complete len:204 (-) Transcript_17902:75-686(-)|eukprot:CAMPEP_0119131496 /NCGR_PEP_ID=MMETSP1310-20130426/10420_1 /TAXON_ID=464262 /ORGANISM="Genus nov. species nov., Strain RCC2339" /LENGTH=203 /DNA_ID=CAMNT_0007122073 /DNA_START=87 /DNA_END=698 /DNA_ORIENTATION=+